MKRHPGMTSARVTILGSGAWGTTLAMVAVRAGSMATLIVRDPDTRRVMSMERRHPRSLAGVDLSREIDITDDAERAIAGADLVIVAIPTQQLRGGLRPMADALQGKVVVSAAKGIEVASLMRPSEIIRNVLGDKAHVVALSGPNLAAEIAAGKPATTVVACADRASASAAQVALMSETFRVYTSDDVVGVEMGGALKNIVAIGAGIGDGLRAGDNAKAAFLTRGIAEIARLGVAHGAQPLTFAGLSGIGDLIATCASPLSRNHHVGVELAKGRSLAEILATMSEVAEGVETTRAAIRLAEAAGIEMPIAAQMHAVLFEGKPPLEAVRDLMRREPAAERRNAH
jgi:glycerol-3-phosphate dehydrogenase (NAD(P)+)